jgi:hypothetical protein
MPAGIADTGPGDAMGDGMQARAAMPRSTPAMRWRGAALLRVASFLALWGVAFTSLLASAAWSPLQAALAASAMTGALGLGALYSPLMAGMFAARSGPDGALAARPARGASWTGGLIGLLAMGLVILLAAAADPAKGGGGAAVLALALGVNCAYLPAKAACLVQGCCRAAGPAAPAWLARIPGELRGLEIALTLATLLICWLAQGAAAGMLAAIGFLGHGVTRLVSVGLRGHRLLPPVRDPGLELPVLALAAMAALVMG